MNMNFPSSNLAIERPHARRPVARCVARAVRAAHGRFKFHAAGPVAKTYTYDLAGNPAKDGTTTFTWNAAGRLDKIASGKGKTAVAGNYVYNGLGQRLIKNGTLLTNPPYRFVYDEGGHLIGEYDKNNAVRQETVWLGDTPVAVVTRASASAPFVIHTVHADHLNTPRVIANSANTPVWRWDNSDAFGVGLPNEDPDGNGVKFEYNPRLPGQYYDKETQLHYNYFRDYEPRTGRYVEVDPIGIAGGMNLYAYVGGNPLSKTDPLGLKTFMCTKPLHSLGGEGKRTGWDIPGNPLYHQYLCVNDGKGGYICGGQDQRGKKWYDPLNGPGKKSDDKFDPKACEQEEPDNNCIEQCLIKKFAESRPRYGIPFGTDCQEWSDDALEDCQQQCKKK